MVRGKFVGFSVISVGLSVQQIIQVEGGGKGLHVAVVSFGSRGK